MEQKLKTQRTKERILASAILEFGAKGYEGSSLSAICRDGLSKGLLYHNFKNKDAVYVACVARCYRLLTDYIKEQVVNPDLEMYLSARIRFFSDNPVLGHIFLETSLQPPKPLIQEIDKARECFDKWNRIFFKKILHALSLRPGITEEDALEYFMLMQTMFNGYFSSPAFYDLPFSDVIQQHEQTLHKLLDYMLYGVAKGQALP